MPVQDAGCGEPAMWVDGALYFTSGPGTRKSRNLGSLTPPLWSVWQPFTARAAASARSKNAVMTVWRRSPQVGYG
jgi:hypothetical protein